jgi:hypothetical protein
LCLACRSRTKNENRQAAKDEALGLPPKIKCKWAAAPISRERVVQRNGTGVKTCVQFLHARYHFQNNGKKSRQMQVSYYRRRARKIEDAGPCVTIEFGKDPTVAEKRTWAQAFWGDKYVDDFDLAEVPDAPVNEEEDGKDEAADNKDEKEEAVVEEADEEEDAEEEDAEEEVAEDTEDVVDEEAEDAEDAEDELLGFVVGQTGHIIQKKDWDPEDVTILGTCRILKVFKEGQYIFVLCILVCHP